MLSRIFFVVSAYYAAHRNGFEVLVFTHLGLRKIITVGTKLYHAFTI